MIVSKAFWKIVLKNIGSIITPTVVLLMFGTISVTSTSSTLTYEARKPDVVIINQDEEVGLTKNFIEYIDKCLEKFEDDPDVIGVTGYSYPINWNISFNATCMKQDFNASMWGVGFWKKKRIICEQDIKSGKLLKNI
jgi:hypothetical protein